jgi:hypothetical protein
VTARWCVSGRDGIWCAIKAKRPSENADVDPLVCGYVMHFRWNQGFTEPTCPDCLICIAKTEKTKPRPNLRKT